MTQEYVEQLGQLIQGGVAQEAADAGNAGIVIDLEEYRSHALGGILIQMRQVGHLFVSAGMHGPELVKIEDTVSSSGPLGDIENSAAGFQADSQRDQEKE